MNPLNPDDLVAKVDHILETMCFIIADLLDEAPSAVPEDLSLTNAWITFRTATEEGRLELRADPDFLLEAASGLLGIEPEMVDPACDPAETLLELANIIAGEVVALLGGEDHTYTMGLPSEDPSALSGPDEETNLGFDSMGSLFHVCVKRRSLTA